MSPSPIADPLGAFVPDAEVRRAGAGAGPLKGLSFAAKDIYDIAGLVTGCGNPDWAATHAVAQEDAWGVATALAAGAELVGKTITDELAYSLNGQNAHYGTPTNVNAPGRIPGGSSSGSAAAVAGGAADFALGSDTGGSVRIPASYCGIFGLRPTHGRLSLAGVMPLAPSFDTLGWFARDAETLGRVGEVFFGESLDADPAPARLCLAEDAFELAGPAARTGFAPHLAVLTSRLGAPIVAQLSAPEGFPHWMRVFRLLQAREIQAQHGDWIRATAPAFGPEIAERFTWALSITEAEAAPLEAERTRLRRRLQDLTANETVICLPSAPGIAPRLDATAADLVEHRSRVLGLTAMAGLAGL
ncbi:MAG TPA: amidase, partial [Kiloniellaceae bacterium]|nr:amidase [Kiloniellaceae bacterium]